MITKQTTIEHEQEITEALNFLENFSANQNSQTGATKNKLKILFNIRLQQSQANLFYFSRDNVCAQM